MLVTPRPGYILVLRDPKEEVTEGGIVVPEVAQKRPETGTIVAIAEDMDPPTEVAVALVMGDIPPDGVAKVCMAFGPNFKPGQRVLFPSFAGTDFKVDGVDHVVLKERDVIALLEDGDDA
jgi:chaperonin GroES